MSEAHDTDDAGFDLTDVPMDDDMDAADAPKGGETDEDAAAAAPKQGEGERGDLSPDEIRRRYDNSKIALAEERRSRRESDRQLAALREEVEALKRGTTGGTRQEQRADEEIDPEVDPLGALKQMKAKIAAYEQVERQENQTQAERDAQERRFASVEQALSEHEADFKDEHPDYDDAAKHYAVTRAQELMGFGLTPAQVQMSLREEFVKLAATAIAARKNPAAVVYQLAKGRGYGKTAADPAPKGEKGGKIDALKRGEKAASPLGGSGGRATTGLDVQTVASINIRDAKGADAFDKAWEALERQAKQAERAR